MENYKILDVLRTFDKKELRRFREFTGSSYYNKNKNVINLLETLTKFHPTYKHKNLTLEKLYADLFPGNSFNYHKINNIISDLYKLSERFLAQQQIEKKEFHLERNILRELRDRKLYKIYEQLHSSYIKKLIERKFKDEDYFFYLYELNDEYLWYATIKKPNTHLNILQTEFDHFFHFILIRLLRFYNLMLHERNQNNVEYEMTLLDEIISHLHKYNYDNPSVKVFRTILYLLKTKETKYYEELQRLKEKYFYELRHDDQYLIFIHLYDFAAYMVNFKGDDRFNKDMFEIYREMLEKKFMTKESFLYPNFLNVVKIACRVGEFKWAESFIADYKSSIPDEEKENVLEFCYGTIAYAKGDLERALAHYSKSNFQNFIFRVQVKILLLKIYYKLGMYEEAFGIIDTFRHYINREKKLLKEHRDSYRIFLKLVGDLIKEKENPNKNQREFNLKKIREETRAMPANPFRIKTWLLEELR